MCCETCPCFDLKRKVCVSNFCIEDDFEKEELYEELENERKSLEQDLIKEREDKEFWEHY